MISCLLQTRSVICKMLVGNLASLFEGGGWAQRRQRGSDGSAAGGGVKRPERVAAVDRWGWLFKADEDVGHRNRIIRSPRHSPSHGYAEPAPSARGAKGRRRKGDRNIKATGRTINNRSYKHAPPFTGVGAVSVTALVFLSVATKERSRRIFALRVKFAVSLMRRFFDSLRSLRMTRIFGSAAGKGKYPRTEPHFDNIDTRRQIFVKQP